MLNPAAIPDEDPMCAQLRMEVEMFFWDRISTGALGEMSGGGAAGETGAGEAGAQGTSVDVSLIEFELQMETTVPAGTVTFNITNNGTEEHSFEIEGNGVEEELEPHLMPGESGTLTVDLQPGTYEVYCPVADHADMGMRLELTVQ
jgi:uncharacterized cupredoxin-like copper-binding protein